MSFLKTLGAGMYYRLRRISKAIKNWKKFGVVIFGSLFVVGSLFGQQLADASTSFHVSLSPTASTITLGSNKLSTAQAFNGINNVTDDTSFSWTAVRQGDGTILRSYASTWTFRPTVAGVYDINVQGTYTVDGSKTLADVPAVLTVTEVPDATNYLVNIVQPTATSSTISMGGSMTYLAAATYGATVTDNSTFGWVAETVAGNNVVKTSSTKQFTFTPTTAGTYSIKVRGIYVVNGVTKTAWSEPVTLIVNPISAQTHLTVAISPTATNPILVGGHKAYTAQAFNGVKQVTDSTDFYWTAIKNGQPVAHTTGSTWDYYPIEVGTYTIKAVGTYRPDGAHANEDVPATLVVQATPPSSNVCSLIDITTGDLNLRKGDSEVGINYYTQMSQGGSISDANLVWNWTGGVFNTSTHKYAPTQTGDFTLSLACRQNTAIRDSINIHVDNIVVDEDYIASVNVYADRNQLCLLESTGLSAQAYNQHGQPINGASYSWEKIGIGYLTGDRYSQYGARFNANSIVGSSRLLVSATWNGRSVSNETSVYVRDCSNPNPTYDYYINGDITAVTQDGKPVCTGSVIVYTVRLNNLYNTTHNVRLSMTLPSGVRFLETSSASDNPTFNGNTISWTPNVMAQGQTVVLTVKAVVKDEAKIGTNLQASAFVQADEKPNGFYLYSNNLKVICGGGPIGGDLPTTGASAWILAGLAVLALGLSFMTYRWLNRKMAQSMN